jgi:hypothetical protein
LRALRELEFEGLISVSDVPYYGYTKREFVLRSNVESPKLSSEELVLLDDMTRFVCTQYSAKGISEFSHDISWHMVPMGDVIPYHLAFNLIPSIVSAETLAWAESEADQVERARSQQNPLEFADFSALRRSDFEARR